MLLPSSDKSAESIFSHSALLSEDESQTYKQRLTYFGQTMRENGLEKMFRKLKEDPFNELARRGQESYQKKTNTIIDTLCHTLLTPEDKILLDKFFDIIIKHVPNMNSPNGRDLSRFKAALSS
ncbi:hypothetical protein LAZ67_4003870 [Cordylochernes scorpioides]|uniref:Uncharacterized protein n=1 Tax=Cordylochernes scorpioides TaxID=51811 RepID=A0ABY6KH44_9ARAC|nr:hypothetical protein LAZ67_4003870 [Cordylochernes scorpioides]